MATYNEGKLRRLMNERRGKHAEYMALADEIRFVKTNLNEFERLLMEADKNTEVAINREIYLARTEKREPKEIKFFVDLSVDEMIRVFKTHPIKDEVSFDTVQNYVTYRKELEALTERQREIEERLAPLNGILKSCKTFLEQNGVRHHGITVGE